MDEYISKEDAINALLNKGQHSRRYGLGETWELNLMEIQEAIKAIPAIDVQPVDQWISVDDKLPRIGESVLVAVIINAKVNLPFRTDFTPELRIGWLEDNGEWGLQFDSADRDEILYWQPLPEPPQD